MAMVIRWAAAALALSASSAMARDDCVRDEFHTEMYRRACEAGGQMAAKEAASRFLADRKAMDPALRCTSCHRSLAPDYSLMPGAVERFEKLAVPEGAAGAAAAQARWVPGDVNLPADAVGGGQEAGRTLFICRASHAGGHHPGKIVGGRCSIGFMGREHRGARFEVLAGPAGGLHWVDGGSPQALTALRGSGSRVVKGTASGVNLPVCRAKVLGGLHPGKLLNNTCHIGYGGREMRVRRYEVLVRR